MWIQALRLMPAALDSRRGAVFGKLLANAVIPRREGLVETIVGELSIRRKSGARRGIRKREGEPQARRSESPTR